jgi:hypothetical protein
MIFKKIGNMEDVEVICHYLACNSENLCRPIGELGDTAGTKCLLTILFLSH